MEAKKARVKINGDTLESVRNLLKDAPPPTTFQKQLSKQDAISELRVEIESLTSKGYSIEAIAELLTQGGISINGPTLKSYMQRSRTSSGVTSTAPVKRMKKQSSEKQESKQVEIFDEKKPEVKKAEEEAKTASTVEVTKAQKNAQKTTGFVKPDTEL